MDFLKAHWSRIQQQIAGLNGTQRMLAGAIIVIMGMTIYWWAVYAGRSEMVPVLDQSLEASQIRGITLRLKSLGIPYETSGDRVLVPSERQLEAWADLSYSQLLPQDTEKALVEMIKTSNPFASRREIESQLNKYKEAKLTQMIRLWPPVKHAAVVIDNVREPGPGGVRPKATVNIMLQPGQTLETNRQLVDAAADLVSGSVADLSRSRVSVVVNGVSRVVRERSDAPVGSDDWQDQVDREERRLTEKLLRQFAYIPEGVLPSVSVKLNLERTEKNSHQVEPKGFKQAVVEETTNTESKSAERAAETGVGANGGITLPPETVAGDSTSETNEKSRTEYRVDTSTMDVRTLHPGGEPTVVSASVLLPRSYFVKVFKDLNGKEPDAALLDDFIRVQLTKAKETARKCLGLLSDDAVQVDVYADLSPTTSTNVVQAAGTSLSLSLTSHAREIALGVLAVVSLVMVSNMVKKGAPAPAVAAAPSPRRVEPLATGEEFIGEAGEGNPLLDGMEVDEDSVKAQQMVSQVQQMVDSNPDAAAALVKRWLSRS